MPEHQEEQTGEQVTPWSGRNGEKTGEEMDIEKKGNGVDEELDIVQLIGDLPDEEATDTFDQNAQLSATAHGDIPKDSTRSTGSSSHEFSLSSIGFALAGTLTASTNSIVQSLSQIQTLGEFSERGSGKRASKFANKQPVMKSVVDFGVHESRAARLRYSKEDLADIVEDEAQFDDLRQALRAIGAVTDGVLKETLHFYIKNTKRARRLARQREEERHKEEEEKERELEPTTPPTEQKMIDSSKVLQSAGPINTEDPSPKSVRGIFVPSS